MTLVSPVLASHHGMPNRLSSLRNSLRPLSWLKACKAWKQIPLLSTRSGVNMLPELPSGREPACGADQVESTAEA
jgi:hypothetical protein